MAQPYQLTFVTPRSEVGRADIDAHFWLGRVEFGVELARTLTDADLHKVGTSLNSRTGLQALEPTVRRAGTHWFA